VPEAGTITDFTVPSPTMGAPSGDQAPVMGLLLCNW
jgi:hypothetical protein